VTVEDGCAIRRGAVAPVCHSVPLNVFSHTRHVLWCWFACSYREHKSDSNELKDEMLTLQESGISGAPAGSEKEVVRGTSWVWL